MSESHDRRRIPCGLEWHMSGKPLYPQGDSEMEKSGEMIGESNVEIDVKYPQSRVALVRRVSAPLVF